MMVNYIAREVEKLADDLGIDRKRSIGEVAKELKVATHVIRFWEENFPQIKPEIGAGKRRYYYNKQLKILKRIKKFLYEDGYTVAGLQKLLKSRKHEYGATEEDLDIILNQKSGDNFKKNDFIDDVDFLEKKFDSQEPQSDPENEEVLESQNPHEKEVLKEELSFDKFPNSHSVENFLPNESRIKVSTVFDPQAKLRDFTNIKISAIDANIREEISECLGRIKENIKRLKNLKVDARGG